MASQVRERMIKGTLQLLARHGLQGTSFSEVLAASGAPRGSLYHHFPGGKDELVAEAIALASSQALSLLEAKAGDGAEEVAKLFLHMWRELLTRSQFGAGCAVAAVTVATDSPDLLARAGDIFRSWRARLAELLTKGGLKPRDAARFAATLIAASEGAVILCRAEKSLEPLDLVSEQLLQQLRKAM